MHLEKHLLAVLLLLSRYRLGYIPDDYENARSRRRASANRVKSRDLPATKIHIVSVSGFQVIRRTSFLPLYIIKPFTI